MLLPTLPKCQRTPVLDQLMHLFLGLKEDHDRCFTLQISQFLNALNNRKLTYNSEPDADDKIAMINGGTIRICILMCSRALPIDVCCPW